MKTEKIKYLLQAKFRYNDEPNEDYEHDLGYSSKTKVITIGLYDTLDLAILEGNKTLSVLSKSFKFRPECRFSQTYWQLVTDFFDGPVKFAATIEKLTFGNLEKTVDEAFKANGRCIKYKKDNDID